MSHTITIRLDPDLAAWLEQTAKQTGVSQGQIVRDQLHTARSKKADRRFMRLAGCVDGPRSLSSRKGFSKR
jgi:predicted transcriptional regulator